MNTGAKMMSADKLILNFLKESIENFSIYFYGLSSSLIRFLIKNAKEMQKLCKELKIYIYVKNKSSIFKTQYLIKE